MSVPDRRAEGGPLISVVMANFQAGEKIVVALRSVLAQSMADLEVIVSDDASQDNSLALVTGLMATDTRIRLSLGETNRGPAHCRNRALALARGQWIAVVDSDDIIHPERFERLLAAAAADEADIIADDLLLFHEDGSPPQLMLGDDHGAGCIAVTPRDWVLAGLDGTPALGYLKPMIRADRLSDARYNEALRIGEDYDFVMRLLLAGARMTIVPEPFYLYRRHAASISHRLSVADMQAMISWQQALVAEQATLSPELAAGFAKRLAVLQQGLSYEQLVASIKGRKLSEALALLLGEPAHLQRLWSSFTEGRQRRDGRQSPRAAPLPSLVLGGADWPLPDYVPADSVDWSLQRPRTVWRDLAVHAGAHCTPLDAAGRYAAGFIPEVVLAEDHALQVAS
ncbi:MAG: glycosyltransferase family 2 protein [Cypionkella sp.]